MNEKSKTLAFFGVALASTALAFATRPAPIRVDAIQDVGEVLFGDFTDPAQAKSLRIVRFDESLASLSQIEVKETEGLWTLPSHDNYPADAENRIRDATTPFVDLRSLAVAANEEGDHDQSADHALFGVLEPDVDKSAVGDQGVGTLVTIRGEGSSTLVNLIIGKEVKGAEGQRYVRRPGQSRVYVAKVDPDALPVRFEDWIEKDLLQVNGFDVSHMRLKDYSFQVAQSLRGPVTDYDLRNQITVRDDNGTWNLEEILVGDGDELVPSELAENEQLNQDKLRELKNALDDLEIVSVERKPTQLGADLRADKGFANEQSGINSLIERGFYPVEMPDGNLEVLSADGEVQLRTKTGVEYVLRFGGIEGVNTSDSEEGALNRFMLVTARVYEDMFPNPDLEDVPQTVEDLQAMRDAAEAAANIGAADESVEGIQDDSVADDSGADGAEADGDAASDAGTSDAGASDSESNSTDAEVTDPQAAESASTTNDVNTDAGKSDAGESDAGESDAGESDAGDVGQSDAGESDAGQSDEKAAADDSGAGDTDADAAADDAEVGESNQQARSEAARTWYVQAVETSDESADTPAGETDSTDEPAAEADETAAESNVDEEPQPSLEDQLKEEQERITRENQRKIDERNEKVEKAREEVRKLNYRFADWYYVISEEVYQKIHLGRDDVVEPSEDESDDETSSATALPNALP